MENISVKKIISTEFQVSEAMKTLRTNLLFSGADVKAVALTSQSAAEGKTTVSLQLAAVMAQTGKRVVLVDADLRASVLQNLLRYRKKKLGLSHYLSGMANADEMLCKTDIPGLYIIFSGSRVPNPAELLGSKSFERLISALKQSFDYVIIDTPPLGMVIDCAVIAPLLDGVIMVIDVMKNSYKVERRVKNQLEKSGGRILGVVLNRVDFHDKHSYYSYGYGGEGPNGK